MKKIRLEMDVPEETWRKCAVQDVYKRQVLKIVSAKLGTKYLQ